MATHIGTHTGLTNAKIRAVSAMIDVVENGKSYNWKAWFIKQLQQVGKNFVRIVGEPKLFEIKYKLRYSGRVLYAMQHIFPNVVWTDNEAYKKYTVFNDIMQGQTFIDRDMINVDIVPVAPTVDRPTIISPKLNKVEMQICQVSSA